MIVDSLMINDELDMLEFRLRYLWERVDKFIIVEADITHQGKSKPLNFSDSIERFKWAYGKIIYHPVKIDVTGLDFSYQPKEFERDAPQWKVENQQRNSILDACREFGDDDVLMVSDCDEIPSHTAVDFRRENKLQYPFACDQRIAAYYLDYVRDDIGWRGTIMCDMKQAREITPQGLRNKRIHWSPFPQGGWHLTFFGGAEQVKRKIQSYAHAECNTEENTDIERIDRLIRKGKGIFSDNGQPLKKVDASFYPTEFLKCVPEGWWL